MKRLDSGYVQAQPQRRPLKIFASDPMDGPLPGNRITIDIPNEPSLRPGPQGARLEVIDYDSAHDRFYPPVNLNDPAILMQGGLDPAESDPRFHQQMVYAVAMKTLEHFDVALGRRLEFLTRRRRKGRDRQSRQRLRLVPHAFHGANAFFSSDLNAILFGYFRSSRSAPGSTMPGQNVFTCLSHDVIAHEMTHALVHRLRPYFLEPSNGDVLAFHEGFSDLVALFQHFAFRELLYRQIQRTPDLRSPGMLIDLARQFGHATGMNRALRSALDDPKARLYETASEPHDRGAILVAAVFDAFFATYQRRTEDLLRIASGGTGILQQGALPRDLVGRIATEATAAAEATLATCIRAFDYLPPVDIRFGDYLRALVTADYEIVPEDIHGLRHSLIEAFRVRGIYADNVRSLAEEALMWEPPDRQLVLPLGSLNVMRELVFKTNAASADLAGQEDADAAEQDRYSESDEGTVRDSSSAVAQELWQYAKDNAASLLLDPALPIEVMGFHMSLPVARDGRLRSEIVAQFAQKWEDTSDLGGIPFRGGTTVVADIRGRVRYVIAKPLGSPNAPAAVTREARERLERQRSYLAQSDAADPRFCIGDEGYAKTRMLRRMELNALHMGQGR